MIITTESQCMTCQNELSEGKCTAYPKGIPIEIWTGKQTECRFYTPLE